MMEKKQNKKRLIFNMLLVSMLVIGAVLGAATTMINFKPEDPDPGITEADSETRDDETDAFMPEDPDPDDGMSWHRLPLASDASPGTSGVINIYTIDSDDGTLDYDSDIAEGDSFVWEHGDADGFTDGEELAGTTPFEEGFDICVEYQFEGSQAVDGGSWNTSRVKAYCNSTSLSISSQLMDKSSAFFGTTGTTDSDTGKINFYLKDADGGAGTGFTIGIDEGFTIDDIIVYYYG